MAKYYSYFPKTYYKLSDSQSVDTVTNLTSSFSLPDNILKNSISYYDYTLAEGDTPEIVAFKVYNSAEKHWIVLKMNDIYDVKTDWPLDYRSLNMHIDSKYEGNSNTKTGLEWAKTNTQSYYKIETQKITENGIAGDITVSTVQVDANVYVNIASSTSQYTLSDNTILQIATTKSEKSYYDYEMDVNDSKKTIKILKPEFVSAVDDEFKRVMSNG